jgi:hypothetical protein
MTTASSAGFSEDRRVERSFFNFKNDQATRAIEGGWWKRIGVALSCHRAAKTAKDPCDRQRTRKSEGGPSPRFAGSG